MRTRCKICGLYREEDIAYINRIKPDYCGFIIDYPKSHRSLHIEQVEKLSGIVDNQIVRVGVFVDEEVEIIEDLLKRDVIDMAQLHGKEDDALIQRLQENTGKPVIKAFVVDSKAAYEKACKSSADYILLDAGKGEGRQFDWDVISENPPEREYFLAGGLNPDNVKQAVELLHPFAVDLSSGVETEKKKDLEKIKEIKEILESI
jgi:phosphoribosylanthranilate isomerase